jgi:hypothetical protein
MLNVVMLSVIKVNVILLNVIMLNVVVLIVVSPMRECCHFSQHILGLGVAKPFSFVTDVSEK